MDIGLTHTKVRLSLLATLVATTSALVAAPVQAGNAPPVFSTDPEPSIRCGVPGQVIASFTVDGKGKWTHLDLALTVNGGEEVLEWDAAKRDRTKPIVWDYNFGAGSQVTVKATLVNRKGESYEADGTTTDTLSKTC